MPCTPDEIAALLSLRDDSASERIARLQDVLAGVRTEGHDSLLAAIVEKLADGARDASWRQPLGESGLLEYVLSTVPVREPQHPMNKQALRLVGNACADCNENRARVVASGALRTFVMNIMRDTAHDALLPFAIAAALNVCVDYTPAQEQASEAGLSKVLVDIISGTRLSSCQSSLGHIMTILELLCNQDAEPKAANPNTPALLLGLATSERYDADLDTFMEICTPALAYLTFQDLQSLLVENNGVELLQQAFHQLYTRFDVADLDSDTASQLKQVGDAFLTVFADISSLSDFPTAYPLDSRAVQTLVDWLGLPPTFSHLQTAACLCLGNLSRSDESSTALLDRVQKPLAHILTRAIPPVPSQPSPARSSAPPLQLTHAALSFLKNLAIPQANKPVLGATLLDPTQGLLPRLWTTTRTQPQLQFTAVSLTRLLLANCPANIRHLCTPLSSNNADHHPQYQSNLALLTSTAASAEEEPIKMEAARAVSLVCRALHSSPATETLDASWTWPRSPTQPPPSPVPSQDAGTRQETALVNFYAAHNPTITRALTHLLAQPRFPTVRAEAIFALALMSRSSPAGAHMALQVLQPTPQNNNGAAWQALAQVITGESESRELAQAFASAASSSSSSSSSRVKEVRDEADDEDDKEDEDENDEEAGLKKQEEQKTEDGGVTVEKLSLEPQQLDLQEQKQQPARAAKMDRENAMVLVAELLRRFPDELSRLRRPLEAVLSKGGELVVQDREEQN